MHAHAHPTNQVEQGMEAFTDALAEGLDIRLSTGIK